MLSILIPVYNYNVLELVIRLHIQAQDLGKPFEIIVADDGSEPTTCYINSQVERLNSVRYYQFVENSGRSKIRNKLAYLATYDYLLFLDCDSRVPDENFLKRYIGLCEGELVICGGRLYDVKSPDEKEFYLRWFYGTHREVISAVTRNQNPYKSFMTNNFVIAKSVFYKIIFDESLNQYGHEDTLFGNDLYLYAIPVKHIDNGLVHIGLESANDFLIKTRQSVENLLFIFKSKKGRHQMVNVKLLRWYRILYYTGLRFLMSVYFKACENKMCENLTSADPSLRTFDLYKLGYMCTL